MSLLLEMISLGATGLSAVAGLILAIGSLGMMIANITHGRGGYLGSIGLLLAASAYLVANIGVFVVTISADRFAIFERVCIASTVFVGPAVMLVALLIVAGFGKRPGWIGLFGFTIWLACIGFGHLWVIAQISASV